MSDPIVVEWEIEGLHERLDTMNGHLAGIKTHLETMAGSSGVAGVVGHLLDLAAAHTTIAGGFVGGVLQAALGGGPDWDALVDNLDSSLQLIAGKVGSVQAAIAPTGEHIFGVVATLAEVTNDKLSLVAAGIAPEGQHLQGAIVDGFTTLHSDIGIVAGRLAPTGQNLADILDIQGDKVRDGLDELAGLVGPEGSTLFGAITTLDEDLLLATTDLGARLAPPDSSIHEAVAAGADTLRDTGLDIAAALAPPGGSVAAALALLAFDVDDVSIENLNIDLTGVTNSINTLKTTIETQISAAKSLIALRLAPEGKSVHDIAARVAPENTSIYDVLNLRVRQIRDILGRAFVKEVTYTGDSLELDEGIGVGEFVERLAETADDMAATTEEIQVIDWRGMIATFRRIGRG